MGLPLIMSTMRLKPKNLASGNVRLFGIMMDVHLLHMPNGGMLQSPISLNYISILRFASLYPITPRIPVAMDQRMSLFLSL